MKFGVRKPSIKKSIKARTTGRAKRAIKSSVNPLYGKKGMGLINDPKKSVYNKVYNKTTVSAIPKGNKNTTHSNINKRSSSIFFDDDNYYKYTDEYINNYKNDTINQKENLAYGILFFATIAYFITVPIAILFFNKYIVSKFFSLMMSIPLYILVVNLLFKNRYKNTTINDNSKDIDLENNIENNDIHDEVFVDKEAIKPQVALYQKQINESAHILNTTKNPDTFFTRHDFILEKIHQVIDVIAIASAIPGAIITGDNLEDYLKEFEDNKAERINAFINRYYEDVLLKIDNLKTEKAKINNANKFYENLMKYEDQLETENIETINILYTKLKENIN